MGRKKGGPWEESRKGRKRCKKEELRVQVCKCMDGRNGVRNEVRLAGTKEEAIERVSRGKRRTGAVFVCNT